MELLIVHAPYDATLQPAIMLENPAYCNAEVIDQLKRDLTEQNIEIFDVVNNVVFAEDGCHIITEPQHVQTHLKPNDHPVFFIQFYLTYPHLIPQ